MSKLNTMLFRRVFWIISALIIVTFLVIPELFNTRSSGPAISVLLNLTKNGSPISPSEIESIHYAFLETPPSLDSVPASTLKPAHLLDSQQTNWHLFGPFSETKEWAFAPTVIEPQYKSLFIKVVLKNGGTRSLSYPMISDTRMRGQVFLDVSD